MLYGFQNICRLLCKEELFIKFIFDTIIFIYNLNTYLNYDDLTFIDIFIL